MYLVLGKALDVKNVLMKFVEDCKAALDERKVCGAFLTDLSKAFDCLPYRLLISKLKAYGMNKELCRLIVSYLLLIVSYFSDLRQ